MGQDARELCLRDLAHDALLPDQQAEDLDGNVQVEGMMTFTMSRADIPSATGFLASLVVELEVETLELHSRHAGIARSSRSMTAVTSLR